MVDQRPFFSKNARQLFSRGMDTRVGVFLKKLYVSGFTEILVCLQKFSQPLEVESFCHFETEMKIAKSLFNIFC